MQIGEYAYKLRDILLYLQGNVFLKLQYALSTFLTNCTKLKPSVAALSGTISSRSIAKLKFRTQKVSMSLEHTVAIPK